MSWLRRLWKRKDMEDQLEKELRFHLDQHASDLVAQGLDPDEARRQARLILGGPEQVKEQCRDARGTRWLEDLWRDLRYTLRTLLQRPGFLIIVLCTLALGSGSTTIMFTVVNGILLKPLSFRQPERLISLYEQPRNQPDQWPFSYPDFVDCRRESRLLQSIDAWRYSGGTITAPGEPEYVSGRQISSDFLPTLGVNLALGRSFLTDEDRVGGPPVIILSHDLWQHRFGAATDLSGKSLVFDGVAYAVVGVTSADFRLFEDVNFYTPIGQSTDRVMQNREAHPGVPVVARLKDGVTIIEAQQELAQIAGHLAEQYPKSDSGHTIIAQPLRQALVGKVGASLWLLLGAVSLVLLIACVNVASLMLARAISRERELAVRIALGASRGRLVRQCLTESSVLGLSGGAIGVLLAIIGVRPFIFFWPGSLPRVEDIHFDWRVLLFALGLSLFSGLLFGLAPALLAPAHTLESALRSGGRTITGGSRRLHGVFVVSEVALAVVLLVSAGMLGRSVLRLSSVEPGFDARNVLVTRLALSPALLGDPSRIRAAWQEVLDRAKGVPGVQSAALTDIVPMRVGENELAFWTTPEPPPPNQAPIALATAATSDYLKVMGIPLRRGRFVTDQDRFGAEPVVVIDEVLAQKAFAGQDPLGKRLWVQGIGPQQVVGVVGHVRHWGLAGDDISQVRAQMYYPFAQVPESILRFFSTFMTLEVRTSAAPLGIVEPLRRELRGATGDQTLYDISSMDQVVSGTLNQQKFLLLLFGIFSGLALLLACIGIYGVLAYLTNQRVPEIGVRMALGASSRRVVLLVLNQSLGMILIGIGLGLFAAVAAGHLLERLVPGVRLAEPATFAIMILVLVIAALFASFIPARRASRIDPISALRQE